MCAWATLPTRRWSGLRAYEAVNARVIGHSAMGQRVVRKIRPGVIPKLKVSLRADEYGKPGTALQVEYPPMMTTVVWVEVNLRSALLLESPLCAGYMLLSGLCPQAE